MAVDIERRTERAPLGPEQIAELESVLRGRNKRKAMGRSGGLGDGGESARGGGGAEATAIYAGEREGELDRDAVAGFLDWVEGRRSGKPGLTAARGVSSAGYSRRAMLTKISVASPEKFVDLLSVTTKIARVFGR
jgi:hypothetical protein